MLADNMARHAHRTAIVDGDTRISYAELAQWMQQVAAGLHARNLGPGDMVAIWAPNSWQWVIGALACWWRGCTLVPIPARGRILDALPLLQSTRARLLFTCFAPASGNLLSLISDYLVDTHTALRDICPHLQAIVDISGDESRSAQHLDGVVPIAGLRQVATPVPAADVAGADVAVILFTSGSTGRPKGVLRRHDQSLRNRWFSSLERGYSHADRLLVVSEFSHSMGLSSNLLCSLMFGATLVIAHNRNPPEVARLIRVEGITSINAPPSLFAGLLRERTGDKPACGNLRLALTAATSIPPALVRELIGTGIDAVVSSYGMTECEIIATTGIAESADVIATTVGKPIAGLDVRITDANGATLPSGVAGEIWVTGEAVSTCYLGASGEREPVVDAKGWLQTGDMGCFTPAGHLQILGRRKDAMTIHGYTLYPAEIETLLIQSGMLKDIAVLGVPHELAGEICVAFIVPADALTFSLKRLRLWARDHVADYKIPARFLLLDQLPLNRAGKVDRISLRNSLDA
jgi:acyl-CoA synthetase (AMP-forming)/AMP-acid ligase II